MSAGQPTNPTRSSARPPVARRRAKGRSRKTHCSTRRAELDAIETREWLDSLDYLLQSGGPVKVARLLRELGLHATQNGVRLPFSALCTRGGSRSK